MNKQQRQKILDMQLYGVNRKIYSGQRKHSANKQEIKKFFFYNLQQIINKWNYEDIQEAISYILNMKSKNFDFLRNMLLPKDLPSLNRGYLISTENSNIERLLCWYAILINSCSEKLNRYIKLKAVYENALINGNYLEAQRVLDEIDSSIGVSLWGLDNRFILSEYRGGLEGNKEYLAKINAMECDVWVWTLADFFSFKAEKGVNNRQYVHRIEKFLEKMSDDLKPFFIEKLYPLHEFEMEDIYNLLYFNSGDSIIDIYNAYIKACVRIIVENGENEQKKLKEKVIKSLSLIQKIDDIVLYKIRLTELGISDELLFSSLDNEMLEIADLYTCGKYEEVIRITENMLIYNSNCFELYEYYVKSFVMLNDKIDNTKEATIKNEIINSMYTAYVKNDSVPKAYITTSRITRLFSNSYLSAEFACFFADKYMIGLDEVLLKAKELLSPFINLRIINVNPEKGDIILDGFERKFEKKSAINLYKYVILGARLTNLNQIDNNRLRWYKIKKEISENIPNVDQELYNWYQELKDNNSPYSIYQKERISTELYYLYVERDMYLEAEKLLVDTKIANRYSTLRMDIDALFFMPIMKSKEIKKDICTPIVTYLYNKNDYTAVYSAVANFLDHNGIEKPSDLFEIEKQFEKKQLIFFLRYVCVYEILDSMYNVFEFDEEVENERIEICRYLQINDVANANDYIQEISQIMQKQKILQGINYLEDVKIDIDFNKVAEEHHDVFNDNYKRFQHIGELEIEYAAYDVTNNKLYIKSSEDLKKYNHKLLVFKEMLFDYRQELAFGKYGMDSMLGTRIRHGSLQNHIRFVFEKNHIAFVSKSTEDRTYLPSNDFEKDCSVLDKVTKDKLSAHISEFSKQIDDYIDSLNAKYIRIQTEDKNENGLFVFTVNLNELIYLFQETQKLQNENLVLELFKTYWMEKIEISISKARDFFSTNVKQDFIDMLNKLEKNINMIEGISVIQNNLIDSISRSRTEIQKAIDVIIDWYKMPREQEYESYDANSLVETCEMINKRAFANYEFIQLQKSITVQSNFIGRTFSYMVDIMVILFTNAYYHSGYIGNISELKVNLEMIEDKESLTIFMKNNLNNNINMEELYYTIEEVRNKLNECIQKRESYNYEGKSGYIKICKILDYNLSCNSYLEFGLDSEQTSYWISIKMPKKNIIVEDELWK